MYAKSKELTKHQGHPLVAVIVPVYNARAYLDECMRSIVSQRVRSMQVIVVDDGSDDGSGDMVDKWAEADSRVVVVHQPNGGPSSARNRGLDMATSEYVVFVDADDVMHPHFLEHMLDAVSDADIARCGVSTGTQCRWTEKRSMASRMDAASAIECVLYQRGWHNAMWGHLFRRQLFGGLKFREGTIYEDLDIIYRVYERAGRGVVCTDAPLYFYRQHPGSAMNTFGVSRTQVLDVVDRIERYFAGNARLSPAARHRSFSAHFNMLGLMARYMSRDVARDMCWPAIVRMRGQMMADAKARVKNRIAAFMSHLGPDISIFIAKHMIR